MDTIEATETVLNKFDMKDPFTIVYPEDTTLSRVALKMNANGSGIRSLELLSDFRQVSIEEVALSCAWWNLHGHYKDKDDAKVSEEEAKKREIDAKQSEKKEVKQEVKAEAEVKTEVEVKKNSLPSPAPDPAKFLLKASLQKWAKGKGVDLKKLENYRDVCLTWHGSKGNHYTDWSKVIQTWINKDTQKQKHWTTTRIQSRKRIYLELQLKPRNLTVDQDQEGINRK